MSAFDPGEAGGAHKKLSFRLKEFQLSNSVCGVSHFRALYLSAFQRPFWDRGQEAPKQDRPIPLTTSPPSVIRTVPDAGHLSLDLPKFIEQSQ
jgi:hypothetical protein